MRNTAEYPITVEECVAALEEASRRDMMRIGSIQPYALSIVKDFLVDSEGFTTFDGFLAYRMRKDHGKS